LRTPAGQLRREQPVEEGVRRDLAAHRLAQEEAELLGGVAAAERRQPVPGRVDVKPRLRRAHRATSASAALSSIEAPRDRSRRQLLHPRAHPLERRRRDHPRGAWTVVVPLVDEEPALRSARVEGEDLSSVAPTDCMTALFLLSAR
jgi:hypothetical protein